MRRPGQPRRSGAAATRGWPVLFWLLVPAGASDDLPALVGDALRRSAEYLTRQVARDGAYPVSYPGEDFSPAATAAIGLAFHEAGQLTGEAVHRAGALAAAGALARVQLASGGWAEEVTPGQYTRRQRQLGEPAAGRQAVASLRPELTPAGLRLLQAVSRDNDQPELTAAAEYGLRAVLNAQLTPGCWPATLVLDGGPPIGDVAATAALVELLVTGPSSAAAVAAGRWLHDRADPIGWAAAYEVGGRPVGAVDDRATAAAVTALLALHAAGGETWWLEPLEVCLPRLRETAPELAETVARRLRQPALIGRPRTEAERIRLTAARLPEVERLLGSLDDDGRWLTDGRLQVVETAAKLRFLTAFLADYEPAPTWPASDARPPQHRR